MSEPSVHVPEHPVLVGYGGEGSDDALVLGGLLARTRGSALVVAAIYHADALVEEESEEYAGELRARAEESLAAVPESVGGVQVERRAFGSASAARGLHDLAHELHAGVAVVGSTHRGPAGRVLVGATADSLLHGAPCAVAVAPRDYASHAPETIGKVTVAVNGTPESERALEAAAHLARTTGASLRIVSVVHLPATSYGTFGGAGLYGDVLSAVRESTRVVLDSAAEALSDLEPETELIEGDPGEALVADTAEGPDLLVLGSRGFGPVRSVLLGGVSSRVAREAACPVLVVPRGVGPDGSGG